MASNKPGFGVVGMNESSAENAVKSLTIFGGFVLFMTGQEVSMELQSGVDTIFRDHVCPEIPSATVASCELHYPLRGEGGDITSKNMKISPQNPAYPWITTLRSRE